jgi:hypothetical protein
MLSHLACKLWKKSGEKMWLMSPRVAAVRIEIPDKDGKSLGMHFVHGHAIQQDANDIVRDGHCGHLDEGLDARQPGDFVIFTTDANWQARWGAHTV